MYNKNKNDELKIKNNIANSLYCFFFFNILCIDVIKYFKHYYKYYIIIARRRVYLLTRYLVKIELIKT